MTVQHYTIFDCAHGVCGIAWNEAGIARFQLPGDSLAETEQRMLRRLPGAERGEVPIEISLTIEKVQAYFRGDAIDFTDLSLDLSDQTELFRRIYGVTRSIGWGATTTYGALAATLELGPAGAWTIGQAMAKNPIPLIIPCHRVLAAGRKIGGFSAPGGTASKLRMLDLEGACLPDSTPAQQSFAF